MSRSPKITFAALAAASLVPTALAAGACPATETAQYTVTFDAVWSAQTHPQDFPPGPHFSGLVGGTHDGSVEFWASGALASPGIESMAETGSKTTLINEVNAAIADGGAADVLSGGGIGLSPGVVSLTFDVTQSHSLVTLVSMIAPSPDWFVGVSGLELFDGERWLDEVVVDLQPYDSGTDSGISYTSPNNDTNPQEPIFEITGYPFLNDGEVLPLGTFTFSRVGAPCLDLCVDNLIGGGEASFEVTGADPGAQVAVLWGNQDGELETGSGSWCVDFGFAVPGNPAARVLVLGEADAEGNLTVTRSVDPSLTGRDVRFQATMNGTCPEACMSDVFLTVVE